MRPVAVLAFLLTQTTDGFIISERTISTTTFYPPRGLGVLGGTFWNQKVHGLVSTVEKHPSLHCRYAFKRKSKQDAAPTNLTASETLREIAAFLAVQLLQVAMKELGKENGNSKASMEDWHRLAQTLQGPLVETEQSEDNLTTIRNAAGDAVKELLGDESETKLDSLAADLIDSEPVKKSGDERSKFGLANPVDDEEKGAKEVNLMANATRTSSLETMHPDSGRRSTIKQNSHSMKTEYEVADKTESLKSPSGVRIPNVVSAEFGRPLEVVASNVDPLRQMPQRESIAKTDSQDFSGEKQEDLCVVKSTIAEDEPTPATTQESQPEESLKPGNSDASLASKYTQELSQRKLLETRLENEAKSKGSKSSIPTVDKSSLLDVDVPITPLQCLSQGDHKFSDAQATAITKKEGDVSMAESKGESIDSIRDFLSQPRNKHSPLSMSKISGSRLKSIIDARRQPKAFNEEANVAEKYAGMSVGEMAFQVLFDLGMVDINKDPMDPTYDHSDDNEYCEHLNIQ